MDGEITLHRWKMRLPAQVRYCLPILVGKTLRFAPWHPGQPLKPNRYGIPEPDVAPDDTLTPETMVLVVTPLVGFDAQGHRLGMGVVGMIAVLHSGIASHRLPGLSVLASQCRKLTHYRLKLGTSRSMRSALNSPRSCYPLLPHEHSYQLLVDEIRARYFLN